jgi:hypothetical protein
LGGSCSTYDGEEKCIQFWWGNLKGRDHLENLGVNGRMILKRILKKTVWYDVDWIDLAQDKDNWWTLVNAVMNFWVL